MIKNKLVKQIVYTSIAGAIAFIFVETVVKPEVLKRKRSNGQS